MFNLEENKYIKYIVYLLLILAIVYVLNKLFVENFGGSLLGIGSLQKSAIFGLPNEVLITSEITVNIDVNSDGTYNQSVTREDLYSGGRKETSSTKNTSITKDQLVDYETNPVRGVTTITTKIDNDKMIKIQKKIIKKFPDDRVEVSNTEDITTKEKKEEVIVDKKGEIIIDNMKKGEIVIDNIKKVEMNANYNDNDLNCSRWAYNGECLFNPNYMLENCKSSCGMNGVPIELVNTIKKNYSNFVEINSKDNNIQCNEWAKRGECERNPNYMLNECKKSCANNWNGGFLYNQKKSLN